MQAEKQESGTLAQWIVLMLGGQAYALLVSAIQEIIRVPPVTPVPGAPECVEGVFNLRGRVVPIVDLARRLGLPSRERTKSSRVIIIQSGQRAVGLLVDAVTEVIDMGPDDWDAAGDILSGLPHAECFVGVSRVAERLLMALDLDRLLVLTATLAEATPEALPSHG
ncbi:MAG TPA: chemotaxis protein CheW [Oscillatoriaceae cyanobacterium]